MSATVDEIAISIGEPETETYSNNHSDGKKLPTAQFLLANFPTRTGYLDKQNTSLLSRCLYPWKTRFFVLIGGFLFRYADAAGKKPKGVPIPLDAVTINRSETEEDGRCFEVVTIRKVYILRASSRNDCEEWVSAIKDRKSLSIAENMGHRNVSSAIAQINKQAAKAFETTVDNDGKFGMNENPMHSTIIMGR